MTQSPTAIETTLVDTSQFDHYDKFLREYEEMETLLNHKLKQIPKDVVTFADQEAVINDHFKEEESTERKLGNRFKVIPTEKESGSQLESINMRLERDSMIDRFWQDVETEYGTSDSGPQKPEE